jgi:peptide deformylase
MILPVYAYGQPVLRRKAVDVDLTDEAVKTLITNMWETMYHAKGIGLAAPQVGKSQRIFLVDTEQVMDEEEVDKGIKKAFINAQILEESGEQWAYEEGCLSIPNVRGDVSRYERVRISYLDEEGVAHEEVYEGINARVIQHEYDHIEGRLFTELLRPLKKKMISRKLEQIKKGKTKCDYRLKFV